MNKLVLSIVSINQLFTYYFDLSIRSKKKTSKYLFSFNFPCQFAIRLDRIHLVLEVFLADSQMDGTQFLVIILTELGSGA